MKFVSDLRYAGSIPWVLFLLNQLKTIRTCSLGKLALPKRDKNGTSFQTKTSKDNTNVLPGITCSEKAAKTVQASSMRKRAPTKTSKDNTNVQPRNTCSKKAHKNGTSFQQENMCSKKNPTQTMKRRQKNVFFLISNSNS